MNSGVKEQSFGGDIAIVGMSVCVPGAASAAQFWDNLRDGVESIQVLDQDTLLEAGERPDLIAHKNYVPSAARLDGFDMFDAEFFGFSPKEAAILDPQHRKFLEVAWEAMEIAGHPPETVDGPIGVYAGCGMGSYFYFNICSNPGLVDDVGMFLLRHTGNDKDFLSTRVSHIFDLTGPSINLQTACSTSLVAVHYACAALRSGECEMALAGGVTIELPQGRGYLFKENEILSPDGHCHAFDHRAQGTVFGSGAGAVALKRLEDAVADGDHIWAVIKGSAINNDGAAKAGYLAPSVDGQASAITRALEVANVPADTIDYVECHGTGTYLGDPIEVSALSEAFRATTDDTGYCRIGSVKTNIGHLDTAAGVAGLVKTALGLHHGKIPPSLGYEAPNPAIDFETSPFRVNDTLRDWTSHKGPRRAGVNALGVGGTNAHAVLEQAPNRGASEESDFPFHTLCLSGRTRAALDANTDALVAHLRANPDQNLADVAFTLKEGRRGFDKRRVVVAETSAQAADLLEQNDPRRVFTHDHITNPELVFMFPGGGAQFPDMARDLYETEPVFADWMDRGLAHLAPQLDFDLRALWLPETDAKQAAEVQLKRPSAQLPLIMLVEYALAQLWISWGVRPDVLIGHSMGENTAACLAGVINFEDCIDLVLLRGRLFDTVPSGGMLSVTLSAHDLRPLLGDDLDIATVNAAQLTTVSGPKEALAQLAQRLETNDIGFQRVAIDIAAHSRMLDPVLAEFRAFLGSITLSPPQIPIISNRSGAPLSDADATDPAYWVDQLRHTVNFADGIATLAEEKARVYLEVGPGKTLSSLAAMHADVSPGQTLSSLRHVDQNIADDAYFVGVIGRLWALGITADWAQIWGEATRHRLPLPTYAFQRARYFIEPGKQAQTEAAPTLTRDDSLENWGYRPVWKPRFADCDWDIEGGLAGLEPQNWLIFEDDTGVAAAVVERLQKAGQTVTCVAPGDAFARLGEGRYCLAPEQGREGYDALIHDLAEAGRSPTRIAHFWLLDGAQTVRPGSSFHDQNLERGFYSLMALSQALSQTLDSADTPDPVHVTVVTNGAAQVRDEGLPYPEKAMISGPAGVIPHEMPGLTFSTLDIELNAAKPARGLLRGLRKPVAVAVTDTLTNRLLEDLLAAPSNTQAAWRGDRRSERAYRHVNLDDNQDAPVFRNGGTYLITGGFGGIGLAVANDLITQNDANIALLVRDALPTRDQWQAYLTSHSPDDKTARRIHAVQALEAAGGEIMVVVADVTNIEQMRRAKAHVIEHFGPLTGVIHAAGQINDAPVLTKTIAETEAVFGPKITGLRVLDALFPDGELELMVLFASTSTATRPAGQIDYVAANEYLNAFAAGRQGAATKVCAINWGVWSDAGMAADAMTRRLGRPVPEARVAVDAPLLDLAGFDAFGNRVFFTTLSPQTHWVLDQHRTGAGVALLPGTGFVELAAQALDAHGVTGPFDLCDLYFMRPLQVDDNATREMVVRLEQTNGGFDFSVYSTLETGGYQLNAQASIVLLNATLNDTLNSGGSADLNIDQIAARCLTKAISTPDARLASPQEAHLKFGQRWHVLERIALGDGEGLAHLALPEAAQGDPGEGYLLHPGLLDLATGWAMDLVPGYGANNLWVPVSYRSIRVFAPLGTKVISWVRPSEGATPINGFASFEVTLADATGKVCVEISGFQIKRMIDGLDFSQPEKADADAVSLGLEQGEAQALSPDEQRLHYNISQGIRASEGPLALRRALATGLSQVVVSSLDLPGLVAQANQVSEVGNSEDQSFERPDLDTEYEAPETDIEKTVAGYFESLLGLARVGVNDSFFDLGGHSLIAVRLFARIMRTYDVQFPISVLFEAPNVAKCAALIAEQVGGDTTTGADLPSADRTEKHRHLVALTTGDTGKTGQKAPFFMVAGMLGNVLNLRHLALMLGRDRPVYGLQARGLIGDDEPHDTMQDAAADYIAEMRSIQPHGPYFLGGYSGGGITAYEMAQQLEAAGEDVAVLAMIDTPVPVRPNLTRRDKAIIKLHEIRRKGIGYFGEWFAARLKWELEQRKPVMGDSNARADFNTHKIETAFRAALTSYDPKPWNGPLTLFRPPLDRHWKVSNGHWVNSEREYVFDDNNWTQWAPQTEVIEVAGDHYNMVLVPNVTVLAEHLKEIIEQGEQGEQPAKIDPDTAKWLGTAAE
ncbi:MAG: SDR family NAD(P)-dependent oxidoreductase [Rhodobacteraceae bacterium]|nr:SDR family NAD(P)-dependent oxidoreductase [Paracoccaceae bacterium]